MKVLSLFDGMACGMLAMLKAGINVSRYVAYEIDKYAIKTSSYNFPTIEHKGDVFAADFSEYDGFDFLIGGSPCTYWSIAQTQNRETTASGMGWELFSQYVKALNESKPKYFVYENNKSMSKAIRESISDTFGFEPICINSALVSAQNRQRLYWCGIRQSDGTYKKADIIQPEDKFIMLKDVLDTYACAWQNKSYVITATEYKGSNVGHTLEKHVSTMVAEPVRVGTMPTLSGEITNSQANRIYSMDGKSVCIKAEGGGWGAKTGLYAEPVCMRYERTAEAKACRKAYENHEIHHGYHELHELYPRTDGKSNTLSTVLKDNPICEPITEDIISITKAPVYKVQNGIITIKEKQYPIKLIDGYYIIRNLSVKECMRLQTVPDWYEFPVSNAQAYKMLGNGWTVDVIVHILQGLKNEET